MNKSWDRKYFLLMLVFFSLLQLGSWFIVSASAIQGTAKAEIFGLSETVQIQVQPGYFFSPSAEGDSSTTETTGSTVIASGGTPGFKVQLSNDGSSVGLVIQGAPNTTFVISYSNDMAQGKEWVQGNFDAKGAGNINLANLSAGSGDSGETASQRFSLLIIYF